MTTFFLNEFELLRLPHYRIRQTVAQKIFRQRNLEKIVFPAENCVGKKMRQ